METNIDSEHMKESGIEDRKLDNVVEDKKHGEFGSIDSAIVAAVIEAVDVVAYAYADADAVGVVAGDVAAMVADVAV